MVDTGYHRLCGNLVRPLHLRIVGIRCVDLPGVHLPCRDGEQYPAQNVLQGGLHPAPAARVARETAPLAA